jgi:curved DNA-binding protein CbpA
MDPNQAYRVLGLKPGVSSDEVKAAYRDLAQVWHPDRFTDNARLRDKAARNLQRINDAYGVLKDYQPLSESLPPPRDSISSTLGLGDLRDSAAFRAPASRFRRSLRILMDFDPDVPTGGRVRRWALAVIALAIVAIVTILLMA